MFYTLSKSLEAVSRLALPQSLIESLTQCQVRLLLGTLYEALDLPGTRTYKITNKR